jgi:nucleoid DNA-binding protein
MNTPELLARIAAATGRPPAVAADQLDQLVTRLVTKLRRGKQVKIPGLGIIRPSREESQ